MLTTRPKLRVATRCSPAAASANRATATFCGSHGGKLARHQASGMNPMTPRASTNRVAIQSSAQAPRTSRGTRHGQRHNSPFTQAANCCQVEPAVRSAQ